MTQNDWEQLEEGMTLKCYVVKVGEVRYQLALQDNLDRWIALELNHANRPVKATVLLNKPELFSKIES